MKLDWKFWAVVIVAALAAFSLTRVIWPDFPSMVAPSAAQLPFFIVIGICEALAFGFGLAFLIFGFRSVDKALPGRVWLSRLAFISVVWYLISWWPHDSLHRTLPEGNYWGLLKIEYGFHVTLMLAGAILAYFLYHLYKERAAGQ